jgi:hypothetical protein
VNIAIGQLLDELGLAAQHRLEVVPDRTIGFDVRRRGRYWATRPADVRRTQPGGIAITEDHSNVVLGQVVHLERRAGAGLSAVAEFDGPEVDPVRMPSLYFSVSTDSKRDFSDVVIKSVGLVERTAQTCTEPVRFIPGRIGQALRSAQLSSLERTILGHAQEVLRHRSRDSSITVYDDEFERLLGQDPTSPGVVEALERQHAELEASLEPLRLRFRRRARAAR